MGDVKLPPSSGFIVSFPAFPTEAGTFQNPFDGKCVVDSDNVVPERREYNNECADRVAVVAENPAIDIEKATEGEDADAPPGPSIATGAVVTWTYRVTNTGDVPLSNVTVIDDRIGDIACPSTFLAPGASMLCTATGIAVEGQYENTGSVNGTSETGTTVSDSDASHYFGIDPKVFDFDGFFPPVRNPPVNNRVNAGSSVPLKFSLGGARGLDIFAPGYPASAQTSCDTNELLDDLEQIKTAGASGLTYDPRSDTYTYVWKTIREWKKTCRRVIVRFVDGSEHAAQFWFK
jgi:hypothetical protein